MVVGVVVVGVVVVGVVVVGVVVVGVVVVGVVVVGVVVVGVVVVGVVVVLDVVVLDVVVVLSATCCCQCLLASNSVCASVWAVSVPEPPPQAVSSTARLVHNMARVLSWSVVELCN